MNDKACFAVLMPVRDDWVSASELLRRIDEAIAPTGATLRLMLVDDGSAEPLPEADFQGPYGAIQSVAVLRLRRNLGHQRAIAIGLAQLHTMAPEDGVFVMDADGEDTPAGLLTLLERFRQSDGRQIVFAERTRRSESMVFRAFYQAYRQLHRGLTGISVRVGNFSLIPWPVLDTLVVVPELWNHYAAAVFRSRIPFTMVPIARGLRIAGRSRMNFTSLVSHGLSAISVFADTVGVRLLIISLVGSLLCLIAIAVVAAIRLFTTLAVPGWATYVTTAMVIIIIQLLTISSSFTFFMLSNRTNLGFVPIRDAAMFVAELRYTYPHE
jgi:hypothetical protein